LIEYNISPSGEDTYSLMAVFIHALITYYILLISDKNTVMTVASCIFSLTSPEPDMNRLEVYAGLHSWKDVNKAEVQRRAVTGCCDNTCQVIQFAAYTRRDLAPARYLSW
jgi:hypothetical protein